MIDTLNKIEHYLNTKNIVYKKNHIIKYETYFKTGGNIKLFIIPNNYIDFKNIINYLIDEKLDYKIIGFTSNVLFLDELEYSIIISTKNLSKLEVIDNSIRVESGYSLQDFVRVAVINQAKGFEGLEGIPASIGGALFMNAGAYGDTISDNLISIEIIDENNNFIELKKEECNFSYRDSIFKTGKFTILRAKFKLVKGNREKIAKNIEKFHIARHSYQDYTYPNLGSMISITGDTYHHIMKNDNIFNILYWILKYLYKNPITKFINRKKPNNIIFNKLLLEYLSSKKGIKLNYTLSTKSSNILINDGSVTSKEIIDYVFLIYNLTNKQYHIENEIVLNPVYLVKDDFKNDYQTIMERLKEIH